MCFMDTIYTEWSSQVSYLLFKVYILFKFSNSFSKFTQCIAMFFLHLQNGSAVRFSCSFQLFGFPEGEER